MYKQLPQVINIINGYKKPQLEQIVNLAKELNITSIEDFWNLFDYIHKEWAENRNYEGWDD